MRPRVKDTFVAQDLTDDSTEVIPVIGLQKVMSLKDRLINRLSQTIKRDVTLEEDTIHQSIKIHVFPNRSSPQAPLDGPTYDDACEPESTADEELGTRLLTLCQDVKGCESSLKNINALAQVASTMTRVIMNLGERLKFFLRKAQISNELYQLICELGFPERIHKTLIRAARTCSNFLHPTIHLERVSLSNAQRSTVWRLKQFVLNKNETEPPAWAQRDYGFKFCKQREEVLLLKEIYNKICKKISLKDLHTACIHGRLYEAAVQKGVFVDAKYKRLMQNDYPSPFLGYENDKGLKNYRGSFFKKR
ncbi:conserved hypothetical protein [Pyrenophora tritici-repentis Pt-1C-BFP]|uniref:Uncharacterized protein n=1 Tax=Pyrenophora tritici-repentis (strain Pt-1C-BFP) TaxID=426418 RepID=B2W2X9_PYRTR|nr:uncharacterized protein PTRG_03777 [Pyrenophora tritici-repentis Pt-1C-BFP]EDU46615.1 conserved hypothetical protein [Pyrenophora tritici-repentis Pt-1C-BFP]